MSTIGKKETCSEELMSMFIVLRSGFVQSLPKPLFQCHENMWFRKRGFWRQQRAGSGFCRNRTLLLFQLSYTPENINCSAGLRKGAALKKVEALFRIVVEESGIAGFSFLPSISGTDPPAVAKARWSPWKRLLQPARYAPGKLCCSKDFLSIYVQAAM